MSAQPIEWYWRNAESVKAQFDAATAAKLENAFSSTGQPNEFRIESVANVNFLNMTVEFDAEPNSFFEVVRDCNNPRQPDPPRAAAEPLTLTALEANEKEAAILEAIEKQPRDVNLKVEYAHFLLARGREGDTTIAERHLHAGAALDARHIGVRVALAEVYSKLGKTDEARDVLVAALTIDPKSAPVHWAMHGLVGRHAPSSPGATRHDVEAAESAARRNDVAVMRAFLSAAGDPNTLVAACGGYSLLWIAARNGSAEVAAILVQEFSADVNLVSGNTSSTALHAACHNGYDRIADVLLRNGARPESLNLLGETPKINAANFREGASFGGAQRCVKLLDLAKAKPSPPPPRSALPPASPAADAGPTTEDKVAKLLELGIATDRDAVRAVLEASGGNVDAAAGVLLNTVQ